ncbi:hypothetical protein PCAR4_220028 [Paraburkholderia caribensis]|nr:hypothetical protein PCAR4_220028 [Paraburkholderia caribensis]
MQFSGERRFDGLACHQLAGPGCAILDPTAVIKLQHGYTGGPLPHAARRRAHPREAAPQGRREQMSGQPVGF